MCISCSNFISDLKLFDIHGTSFLHAPYKLLPPSQNIVGARRFFSLFVSFIFIAHFFVGLREFLCGFAGVLRESRKFFQTLFLYIHLFVY